MELPSAHPKRIQAGAALRKDPKTLRTAVSKLLEHPPAKVTVTAKPDGFEDILPPQKTNISKHYDTHSAGIIAAAAAAATVSQSVEEYLAILMEEVNSPSQTAQKLASNHIIRLEKRDEVLVNLVQNSVPAQQKQLLSALVKYRRTSVINALLPHIHAKLGLDMACSFLHGCSSSIVREYLKNDEVVSNSHTDWAKVTQFHGEVVMDHLRYVHQQAHDSLSALNKEGQGNGGELISLERVSFGQQAKQVWDDWSTIYRDDLLFRGGQSTAMWDLSVERCSYEYYSHSILLKDDRVDTFPGGLEEKIMKSYVRALWPAHLNTHFTHYLSKHPQRVVDWVVGNMNLDISDELSAPTRTRDIITKGLKMMEWGPLWELISKICEKATPNSVFPTQRWVNRTAEAMAIPITQLAMREDGVTRGGNEYDKDQWRSKVKVVVEDLAGTAVCGNFMGVSSQWPTPIPDENGARAKSGAEVVLEKCKRDDRGLIIPLPGGGVYVVEKVWGRKKGLSCGDNSGRRGTPEQPIDKWLLSNLPSLITHHSMVLSGLLLDTIDRLSAHASIIGELNQECVMELTMGVATRQISGMHDQTKKCGPLHTRLIDGWEAPRFQTMMFLLDRVTAFFARTKSGAYTRIAALEEAEGLIRKKHLERSRMEAEMGWTQSVSQFKQNAMDLKAAIVINPISVLAAEDITVIETEHVVAQCQKLIALIDGNEDVRWSAHLEKTLVFLGKRSSSEIGYINGLQDKTKTLFIDIYKPELLHPEQAVMVLRRCVEVLEAMHPTEDIDLPAWQTAVIAFIQHAFGSTLSVIKTAKSCSIIPKEVLAGVEGTLGEAIDIICRALARFTSPDLWTSRWERGIEERMTALRGIANDINSLIDRYNGNFPPDPVFALDSPPQDAWKDHAKKTGGLKEEEIYANRVTQLVGSLSKQQTQPALFPQPNDVYFSQILENWRRLKQDHLAGEISGKKTTFLSSSSWALAHLWTVSDKIQSRLEWEEELCERGLQRPATEIRQIINPIITTLPLPTQQLAAMRWMCDQFVGTYPTKSFTPLAAWRSTTLSTFSTTLEPLCLKSFPYADQLQSNSNSNSNSSDPVPRDQRQKNAFRRVMFDSFYALLQDQLSGRREQQWATDWNQFADEIEKFLQDQNVKKGSEAREGVRDALDTAMEHVINHLVLKVTDLAPEKVSSSTLSEFWQNRLIAMLNRAKSNRNVQYKFFTKVHRSVYVAVERLATSLRERATRASLRASEWGLSVVKMLKQITPRLVLDPVQNITILRNYLPLLLPMAPPLIINSRDPLANISSQWSTTLKEYGNDLITALTAYKNKAIKSGYFNLVQTAASSSSPSSSSSSSSVASSSSPSSIKTGGSKGSKKKSSSKGSKKKGSKKGSTKKNEQDKDKDKDQPQSQSRDPDAFLPAIDADFLLDEVCMYFVNYFAPAAAFHSAFISDLFRKAPFLTEGSFVTALENFASKLIAANDINTLVSLLNTFTNNQTRWELVLRILKELPNPQPQLRPLISRCSAADATPVQKLLIFRHFAGLPSITDINSPVADRTKIGKDTDKEKEKDRAAPPAPKSLLQLARKSPNDLVTLLQAVCTVAGKPDANMLPETRAEVTTAVRGILLDNDPTLGEISADTKDQLLKFQDADNNEIRNALLKLADSASWANRKAAMENLVFSHSFIAPETRQKRAISTLKFFQKKLKNESMDNRTEGLFILFESAQGAFLDILLAHQDNLDVLLEMVNESLEAKDVDLSGGAHPLQQKWIGVATRALQLGVVDPDPTFTSPAGKLFDFAFEIHWRFNKFHNGEKKASEAPWFAPIDWLTVRGKVTIGKDPKQIPFFSEHKEAAFVEAWLIAYDKRIKDREPDWQKNLAMLEECFRPAVHAVGKNCLHIPLLVNYLNDLVASIPGFEENDVEKKGPPTVPPNFVTTLSSSSSAAKNEIIIPNLATLVAAMEFQEGNWSEGGLVKRAITKLVALVEWSRGVLHDGAWPNAAQVEATASEQAWNLFQVAIAQFKIVQNSKKRIDRKSQPQLWQTDPDLAHVAHLFFDLIAKRPSQSEGTAPVGIETVMKEMGAFIKSHSPTWQQHPLAVSYVEMLCKVVLLHQGKTPVKDLNPAMTGAYQGLRVLVAMYPSTWADIPSINALASAWISLLSHAPDKDEDGLPIFDKDSGAVTMFEGIFATHSEALGHWTTNPVLTAYVETVLRSRLASLVLWRWFGTHTRKENFSSRGERRAAVSKCVHTLLSISPSAIHLPVVWRHLLAFEPEVLTPYINSGKPYFGVFYIAPRQRPCRGEAPLPRTPWISEPVHVKRKKVYKQLAKRRKTPLLAKKMKTTSEEKPWQRTTPAVAVAAGGNSRRGGGRGGRPKKINSRSTKKVTKLTQDHARVAPYTIETEKSDREVFEQDKTQWLKRPNTLPNPPQELSMDEEDFAPLEAIFDHSAIFTLPTTHQLWRLGPREVWRHGLQLLRQALNPDLPLLTRVRASAHWTVLPTTTCADIASLLQKFEDAEGKSSLAVNLIEALLRGYTYNDEAVAPLQYLLTPAILSSDRSRVAAYAVSRCTKWLDPRVLSKILKRLLSGKNRQALKVTAAKEIVRLLLAHPTQEHIRIVVYEWKRPLVHRDVRITILKAAYKFLTLSREIKYAETGAWEILESAVSHPAVCTNAEILTAIIGTKPVASGGLSTDLNSITLTPRLIEHLETFSDVTIPERHCERFAKNVILRLCYRVKSLNAIKEAALKEKEKEKEKERERQEKQKKEEAEKTAKKGSQKGSKKKGSQKTDKKETATSPSASTAQAASSLQASSDDGWEFIEAEGEEEAQLRAERIKAMLIVPVAAGEGEGKEDEEEEPEEKVPVSKENSRSDDDIAYLAIASLEAWSSHGIEAEAALVLYDVVVDTSDDFLYSLKPDVRNVNDARWNMAAKLLWARCCTEHGLKRFERALGTLCRTLYRQANSPMPTTRTDRAHKRELHSALSGRILSLASLLPNDYSQEYFADQEARFMLPLIKLEGKFWQFVLTRQANQVSVAENRVAACAHVLDALATQAVQHPHTHPTVLSIAKDMLQTQLRTVPREVIVMLLNAQFPSSSSSSSSSSSTSSSTSSSSAYRAFCADLAVHAILLHPQFLGTGLPEQEGENQEDLQLFLHFLTYMLHAIADRTGVDDNAANSPTSTTTEVVSGPPFSFSDFTRLVATITNNISVEGCTQLVQHIMNLAETATSNPLSPRSAITHRAFISIVESNTSGVVTRAQVPPIDILNLLIRLTFIHHSANAKWIPDAMVSTGDFTAGLYRHNSSGKGNGKFREVDSYFVAQALDQFSKKTKNKEGEGEFELFRNAVIRKLAIKVLSDRVVYIWTGTDLPTYVKLLTLSISNGLPSPFPAPGQAGRKEAMKTLKERCEAGAAQFTQLCELAHKLQSNESLNSVGTQLLQLTLREAKEGEELLCGMPAALYEHFVCAIFSHSNSKTHRYIAAYYGGGRIMELVERYLHLIATDYPKEEDSKERQAESGGLVKEKVQTMVTSVEAFATSLTNYKLTTESLHPASRAVVRGLVTIALDAHPIPPSSLPEWKKVAVEVVGQLLTRYPSLVAVAVCVKTPLTDNALLPSIFQAHLENVYSECQRQPAHAPRPFGATVIQEKVVEILGESANRLSTRWEYKGAVVNSVPHQTVRALVTEALRKEEENSSPSQLAIQAKVIMCVLLVRHTKLLSASVDVVTVSKCLELWVRLSAYYLQPKTSTLILNANDNNTQFPMDALFGSHLTEMLATAENVGGCVTRLVRFYEQNEQGRKVAVDLMGEIVEIFTAGPDSLPPLEGLARARVAVELVQQRTEMVAQLTPAVYPMCVDFVLDFNWPDSPSPPTKERAMREAIGKYRSTLSPLLDSTHTLSSHCIKLLSSIFSLGARVLDLKDSKDEKLTRRSKVRWELWCDLVANAVPTMGALIFALPIPKAREMLVRYVEIELTRARDQQWCANSVAEHTGSDSSSSVASALASRIIAILNAANALLPEDPTEAQRRKQEKAAGCPERGEKLCEVVQVCIEALLTLTTNSPFSTSSDSKQENVHAQACLDVALHIVQAFPHFIFHCPSAWFVCVSRATAVQVSSAGGHRTPTIMAITQAGVNWMVKEDDYQLWVAHRDSAAQDKDEKKSKGKANTIEKYSDRLIGALATHLRSLTTLSLSQGGVDGERFHNAVASMALELLIWLGKLTEREPKAEGTEQNIGNSKHTPDLEGLKEWREELEGLLDTLSMDRSADVRWRAQAVLTRTYVR